MNPSALYKNFRYISYVLKTSQGSEFKYIRYRCLNHCRKLFYNELDNLIPSSIYTSQCRKVFSSNLTKSDAKSDEPTQNPMRDEEFQNILKDFAKDFGVSGDSEQVLEDIKKSMDESSTDIKKDHNSFIRKSDSNLVIEEKYKEFTDSDSVTIHSSEDFHSGIVEEGLTYHIDKSVEYETTKIASKRGVTGVFDIGELVAVLHKENLMDIAVISIPEEVHYTDFLVVATAKSPRHSTAVAEYLIKLYKMKKHKSDPFIIVEGEKVSNWKALDMGNIVLHIFLEEARAFYDIESLWLFDSEFDSGGTFKPDPLYAAMEEQMAFFNSLQQPSTETSTKETS